MVKLRLKLELADPKCFTGMSEMTLNYSKGSLFVTKPVVLEDLKSAREPGSCNPLSFY
jgi:hypothetical protein